MPPWLTLALHAIGWTGSAGWLAILALGVAVCVPSVRAFIGAYLRMRGETYATKQDFAELLRQLRLQTEATEDIKRRLSFAGWRDQRGLDLKREFYWNLISKVTERQQLCIEAHANFSNGASAAGGAIHARILKHWPEIAAALNLGGAVLEPAAWQRLHEASAPYLAAARMSEPLTSAEEWGGQMLREAEAAGQFLVALEFAARADLFD